MELPKLHASMGTPTAAQDAILRQTGFFSNRLQIAGQITRGSSVECQARARFPRSGLLWHWAGPALTHFDV